MSIEQNRDQAEKEAKAQSEKIREENLNNYCGLHQYGPFPVIRSYSCPGQL